MEHYFAENLKRLTNKYTQKQIADKTGFSQSSINNYIAKTSEPSIQFLIALKNAFGISVDEFLFSEYEEQESLNYNKFFGNYIVYYYNNSSYKGEIHTNLKNTLNYGVISVVRKATNRAPEVLGTFVKSRVDAVKLLRKINTLVSIDDITREYKNMTYFYKGEIQSNSGNMFISLSNIDKDDEVFMIFNNPLSKGAWIGGLGTINSISRGREHNPCVQYVIISRKLIDKPDGEIYNCLSLDYTDVNFDSPIKDLISLFKRLYVEKNELASELDENQKEAIIENKVKYYFNEVIDANMFRFGKITNQEDDVVYRILKEGIDV